MARAATGSELQQVVRAALQRDLRIGNRVLLDDVVLNAGAESAADQTDLSVQASGGAVDLTDESTFTAAGHSHVDTRCQVRL